MNEIQVQIPDNQFVSLVLLILADRLGDRIVIAWHSADRSRVESEILRERKWLADQNDAATCALRMVEDVVSEG